MDNENQNNMNLCEIGAMDEPISITNDENQNNMNLCGTGSVNELTNGKIYNLFHWEIRDLLSFSGSGGLALMLRGYENDGTTVKPIYVGLIDKFIDDNTVKTRRGIAKLSLPNPAFLKKNQYYTL